LESGPFPVLPFGLKSCTGGIRRWGWDGMGWRKPGVSLVRMRLRPRSVQVGLCRLGARYSCFGLWGEKGNARGSRPWAQLGGVTVSHFSGTRARGSAIKLECRGGWLRGMRRWIAGFSQSDERRGRR
jgi:hypothetical protein